MIARLAATDEVSASMIRIVTYTGSFSIKLYKVLKNDSCVKTGIIFYLVSSFNGWTLACHARSTGS